MTARTAAIVLICATAATIAAVMVVRKVASRRASVEISHTIYPTQGIDISAHNGDIDFKRVAAAGIEFVYMKMTEGATWRDAYFEHNYAAAKAAGLHVGVYHFFRFDVEGWRQSVNLLRSLGDKPLDLPIAIDVEEWLNADEYSTQQVVANLRSLVDMIRQAGREVIIYTNKDGYHRFVRNQLNDVDLWICSFTNPAIPENSRWTIWQYSHLGQVDGITGNVDLCTFNTPVKGPFATWLSTHPAISRIKR